MHAGDSIHELKLVSGWVCLDYINTADRIEGRIAHDWLISESDLHVWGQRVGLVTHNEIVQFSTSGDNKTAETLHAAYELRELLYRIFAAAADGEQPQRADLDSYNELLRATLNHVEIISKAEGYQWQWYGNPSLSTRVQWGIVRSAADLLTAPELRLLRQCPAEDCGWLFLDTSRNHSRRWCDMDDCGNRAKARRHYARSRGSI